MVNDQPLIQEVIKVFGKLGAGWEVTPIDDDEPIPLTSTSPSSTNKCDNNAQMKASLFLKTSALCNDRCKVKQCSCSPNNCSFKSLVLITITKVVVQEQMVEYTVKSNPHLLMPLQYVLKVFHPYLIVQPKLSQDFAKRSLAWEMAANEARVRLFVFVWRYGGSGCFFWRWWW